MILYLLAIAQWVGGLGIMLTYSPVLLTIGNVTVINACTCDIDFSTHLFSHRNCPGITSPNCVLHTAIRNHAVQVILIPDVELSNKELVGSCCYPKYTLSSCRVFCLNLYTIIFCIVDGSSEVYLRRKWNLIINYK